MAALNRYLERLAQKVTCLRPTGPCTPLSKHGRERSGAKRIDARTAVKSDDKPVRKVLPGVPAFQRREGGNEAHTRWGKLRLGHAADRECRVVGRARSSSAALRPKGVAACLWSDTPQATRPFPLFLYRRYSNEPSL